MMRLPSTLIALILVSPNVGYGQIPGRDSDKIDDAASRVKALLEERGFGWLKIHAEPDVDSVDPLMLNAAWRSVEPEVVVICRKLLNLEGSPVGEFKSKGHAFQANNALYEEVVYRALAGEHSDRHLRYHFKSRTGRYNLPVLPQLAAEGLSAEQQKRYPNFPVLRQQINASLKEQGFLVGDPGRLKDDKFAKDSSERRHCRTSSGWLQPFQDSNRAIKDMGFRWRVVFLMHRVDGKQTLANTVTNGGSRVVLTSSLQIAKEKTLGRADYEVILTTGPVRQTAYSTTPVSEKRTHTDPKTGVTRDYTVHFEPIRGSHEERYELSGYRGHGTLADTKSEPFGRDESYASAMRESKFYSWIARVHGEVHQRILEAPSLPPVSSRQTGDGGR